MQSPDQKNEALLKILQVGQPVLRQPARELSLEEIRSEPIQQLIEAMKQTMWAAPGVGLAAPQIGESLQLIVIEDRPEYTQGVPEKFLKERERQPVSLHVLINPKITVNTAETVAFFEGCLSVAGFVGLVPRALCVEVEALNEHAEPVAIKARGWYARILQHETDHLRGTLCIDHMRPRTLMTIENYAAFWKDKSIQEIIKDLKVNL